MATPPPPQNLTNEAFRLMMPEFADTDKYSDPILTQYLIIATAALNSNIWLDFLLLGIANYTAHFLVMQARAQADSNAGGIPGEGGGIVVSKSVGSVSKSYDTGGAAELDGGFWNQTQYGRIFLNFARMVGKGGVVVGAGYPPPGSGPPYFGPNVWGS